MVGKVREKTESYKARLVGRDRGGEEKVSAQKLEGNVGKDQDIGERRRLQLVQQTTLGNQLRSHLQLG